MSPKNLGTVLFLTGPTAAGKTELAIELSTHFNARLISVDSALIYRGMDIGTAKPSRATLQKYPHHLIDICAPEATYSAFDFARDARREIEAAFANNQLPILVGGSSFYFRALEFGLSNLPESSAQSKAKFARLLAENGSEFLHRQLAKIDEKAAQRIHQNDTQRITRALEVFELSGKTLSELQGAKQQQLPYTIQKIVLMPPREILHKRIETRFLAMIDEGLIDEVKTLRQNPNLHADLPSMRCVGYRQIWQYLAGELDKNQAIERGIIATRQLCKRQSTWLKGEKTALFLEAADIKKAVAFLREN